MASPPRVLLALLCLTGACRHAGSARPSPSDRLQCQSPEALAATAAGLEVTLSRKMNFHAAELYEQALAQAARGRLGLPADPTNEACVPPLITVTLELTGDPEDLKAAGLRHASEGLVTNEGTRILSGRIDPLRMGQLARIEHVRRVHLTPEALPQLQVLTSPGTPAVP